MESQTNLTKYNADSSADLEMPLTSFFKKMEKQDQARNKPETKEKTYFSL